MVMTKNMKMVFGAIAALFIIAVLIPTGPYVATEQDKKWIDYASAANDAVGAAAEDYIRTGSMTYLNEMQTLATLAYDTSMPISVSYQLQDCKDNFDISMACLKDLDFEGYKYYTDLSTQNMKELLDSAKSG